LREGLVAVPDQFWGDVVFPKCFNCSWTVWHNIEGLFKDVAQYFFTSPSCYRFVVTESVFHAGGARPHTANVVLDFLHDTFDLCVIWNRFPDRFAWDRTGPWIVLI
jgi:hypothetical protein